jgi:predicted metallo-beta-lactamase superfamily hydrolase
MEGTCGGSLALNQVGVGQPKVYCRQPALSKKKEATLCDPFVSSTTKQARIVTFSHYSSLHHSPTSNLHQFCRFCDTSTPGSDADL